jgi:hypothetical protein
MNATATKQIWWDGNSTTCVEHMGFTLKSEVEARPRKKSHITCFGEAYLMDADEVKAIQAIMESEIICETCAYKAGTHA